MSIIQRLRDHIATCPLLDQLAPLHVDGVKSDPTNYSIDTIPGEIVQEKYLDGSSTRVYPFAFSLMDYAPEDVDRIAASGFFEEFADWLEGSEEQMTLDDGQQVDHLRAVNWGYLQETDPGNSTALYQVQCELKYFQEEKEHG